MVIGSICAFIHGAILPGQFTVFGNLVNEFIKFGEQRALHIKNSSNPAPTINIQEKMEFFSMLYAILALVSLIAGYLQTAFWAIAAIRQTHKIRTVFLECIMKQNIGWFDVNESGGLTARLTE